VADEPSEKPFHNPFGALANLRPDIKLKRPEPPKEAAPPQPAPTPAPRATAVARAVVRLERKGRGGKDVTVIEQIGLNATLMQRWLKELKASLGCGGVLEDGTIVLQGDHRKRLPDLLTKMGVRKVTVSG
jgi:translation initiation factor 1